MASSEAVTDAEWLPHRHAAARLGVSTFVLRGIAKRAGITLQGQVGHPKVSASDLDALLQDTRCRPGTTAEARFPTVDARTPLRSATCTSLTLWLPATDGAMVESPKRSVSSRIVCTDGDLGGAQRVRPGAPGARRVGRFC